MTTEQKALALVNAVTDSLADDIDDFSPSELRAALIAAIEAHEADNASNEQRLADQAKAFSDAVLEYTRGFRTFSEVFDRFILPEPEPDPLVEVAREMTLLDGVVRTDSQKAAIREGRAGNTASDDFYDRLRQALAARGYKIERIDNEHRV